MVIKSVDIKNFTVFEDTRCDFSPGVNLFIGDNGTGKTHLLKILYAMTNTLTYTTLYEGENTFDGKPVTITNNFDHVILPMFNSPVEGLLINLVRNKADEYESAKVEIETDNETITSYVAGLGFLTAINSSDIKGRIAEHEALFIPAKDMLSHSGLENDYAKRELPFDLTLMRILGDLKISRLREHSEVSKALMNKIAKEVGGKVLYKNGGYFIDKGDSQINIALEAEGFKKLAVLYRALDTGYLQPGSILFWDEPEANLSPKLMSAVVDILLELAQHGVQVFLATHDYLLMKYFCIKRQATDHVCYHSLYKKNGSVVCDSNPDYERLKHNPIVEANIQLLEDKYNGGL